MKKIIVIFILLFISFNLYAEISAVLSEISGKVEIKAPGESWKKAKVGMTLNKGDSISTGFKAEAVLNIGPSQLIVKQLTRMELEELIEKEGTVSTGLNLRVGKIKAEVRTTAGLRQNFRLTSPISTAAVRGTSFEYDGVNLKVFEGTVAFTNKRGQTRSINMGEVSKITGLSLPNAPEEAADALAAVISSTVTIPEIVTIFEDLTNITIILDWGL